MSDKKLLFALIHCKAILPDQAAAVKRIAEHEHFEQGPALEFLSMRGWRSRQVWLRQRTTVSRMRRRPGQRLKALEAAAGETQTV